MLPMWAVFSTFVPALIETQNEVFLLRVIGGVIWFSGVEFASQLCSTVAPNYRASVKKFSRLEACGGSVRIFLVMNLKQVTYKSHCFVITAVKIQ